MAEPQTQDKEVTLVPRDDVLVALVNHVDYELACAREYGVGAEIQVLSFPQNLTGDVAGRLRAICDAVAQLEGPIGYHGPFFDTTHYSVDPDIQAVARRRYLEGLDWAAQLGASYMVLHSQYNPIIRVEAYPELYHSRSIEFWPAILERAEALNIPIYLENMFDDTPAPILGVLKALDSPYLRACLDVAHVGIWSGLPLSDWIDALRPYLAHVHVNDCNGEFDDHLGLGEGVLDLESAFAQLRRTRLPLTYALETSLGTGVSLEYLGLRKRHTE